MTNGTDPEDMENNVSHLAESYCLEKGIGDELNVDNIFL